MIFICSWLMYLPLSICLWLDLSWKLIISSNFYSEFNKCFVFVRLTFVPFFFLILTSWNLRIPNFGKVKRKKKPTSLIRIHKTTPVLPSFFFFLDVNECENNVCPEHSDCRNMEGSYTCDCQRGFQSSGGVCIGKWSIIVLLSLKSVRLWNRLNF